MPPQQITRIRRGAPQGQENEIGSTNGAAVDEEIAESEGEVEGELNEETQTKADENEQFLLQ